MTAEDTGIDDTASKSAGSSFSWFAAGKDAESKKGPAAKELAADFVKNAATKSGACEAGTAELKPRTGEGIGSGDTTLKIVGC